MSGNSLTSWGRYPRFPQQGLPIHWQEDVPRALAKSAELLPALAYGCGRSYGDSCLAVSDQVLVMSGMNHLLSANWQSGVVVAEAGLTLAELIRVALPKGWFPPVTPGTKFVTLGGAVANDVHGKNHHVMGTFGRYVKRLTLYRSNEGVITASPTERPEVFAATLGGLGLTGVILTVDLQMRPVASARIEERRLRFGGLDEFFELADRYDQDYEHTVAWIDCLAGGRSLARGHYIAGNHAADGDLKWEEPRSLPMLIDPPFSLVNAASLRAFNAFVYYGQLRRDVRRYVGYDAFLYPLDRLLGWNHMYGRAGFQQYQCVVPHANSRETIRSVVSEIAKSGTGSFLAVLKRCGQLPSLGLMSFPMHGISLALDFPQGAQGNRPLFDKLDALVHDAGGRLYPAKDAHMSAIHFQRAYPAWEQVEALRDPQLMSRFWRRVTQ
jgi:FAD/FMN-containing dehydrogenase